MLVAPLTDHFSTKEPTPEKEKKWAASSKALMTLLKTWPGLISLTSSAIGLRSVVDALKLPISEFHVTFFGC